MSPETVLARRRVKYAEALQRALDRIVNHLANMPEVERVILFGSYAAGATARFRPAGVEDGESAL